MKRMTVAKRKVWLELVSYGQVKEQCKLPMNEARNLLDKPMAKGHLWRIVGPDKTGELPDDETRYAADCAACGVENAYA